VNVKGLKRVIEVLSTLKLTLKIHQKIKEYMLVAAG